MSAAKRDEDEPELTTVPLSVSACNAAITTTLAGAMAVFPGSTVLAGTAAPPLVGASMVTFLKFSPMVAAQLVFLAPIPTLKLVNEKGTTGDLPVLPYASMAVNGVLWVNYGLLCNDFTVWGTNISALALGSAYWYMYAKNAPKDFNMTPWYVGGIAAITSIIAVGQLMPTEQALNVLGMGGNFVVVAMFGGPLSALKTVLRDKSTASLPFPMAIATFANCSLWFSYGVLVAHDPYIWFCNGLGLAAAVAQLSLFARFGITTPK